MINNAESIESTKNPKQPTNWTSSEIYLHLCLKFESAENSLTTLVWAAQNCNFSRKWWLWKDESVIINHQYRNVKNKGRRHCRQNMCIKVELGGTYWKNDSQQIDAESNRISINGEQLKQKYLNQVGQIT